MKLNITILGFLGIAILVMGVLIFVASHFSFSFGVIEDNTPILGVTGLSIAFLLVILFLEQMVVLPLQKLVDSISHMNRDGDMPKITTSKAAREIVILQDALERLFLEAQRLRKLEQKRSESKSEFLTIAAHQMRTPLAGLKWMFNSFFSEHLTPKEKDDYLHKGYETVQSLIQLVNNLLDVASIEEGKFEYQLSEKDLVSVMKDVLHTEALFAQTKNMTIQFYAFRDAILTKIDDEKFRIVITNLLDNAVKYTKAKGTIRLGIQEYNPSYVDIFIQDNGIGIPEKHREHLFEKFSRGENALRMENAGSGLGLYLARNIVLAHGGKIWFESEEGKGTTAHIILPIRSNLIPTQTSFA